MKEKVIAYLLDLIRKNQKIIPYIITLIIVCSTLAITVSLPDSISKNMKGLIGFGILIIQFIFFMWLYSTDKNKLIQSFFGKDYAESLRLKENEVEDEYNRVWSELDRKQQELDDKLAKGKIDGKEHAQATVSILDKKFAAEEKRNTLI